ncbi:hypothetical protein [Novosphingobium sp.]|uniref:hypothetical protein n=1 Tax=Novosphingobium sp. TaxID=1874826 RepID=UPI001D97FF4A|nr:hypothetical protein [Novosphingobium sp.]MBX9663612.1 hypothetical protein [Novosphingobium sp.]
MRQTLASRLERSALPVGGASISISLAVSIARLPLGIPMTVVGLALFGIAVLVNSYAMLTKEMKSAQELGFDRTRDAIVYASSTSGLDWRLGALALCAFAVSFIVGFGLTGEPSSGGALLSFGAFAYLGAIARLQRKWPSDNQRQSNL